MRGSSGDAGGGFGFGGRSIGLGTIVVTLIAGWVFGVNPLTLLGLVDGVGGGTPVAQQGAPHAPAKARWHRGPER